jgi:hypothetical protein
VKNAAGQWIDAPPVPGTFVCNIGDMLKVGLLLTAAHSLPALGLPMACPGAGRGLHMACPSTPMTGTWLAHGRHTTCPWCMWRRNAGRLLVGQERCRTGNQLVALVLPGPGVGSSVTIHSAHYQLVSIKLLCGGPSTRDVPVHAPWGPRQGHLRSQLLHHSAMLAAALHVGGCFR